MRKPEIKDKQQKVLWKSPLFVVCATAIFILGLKMISYLRSDSIDPQVVVEAANSRTLSTESGIARPLSFDSAAIRTADRRREVAALVLAASLYITNETLQGRPPVNVDSIIRGLTEQNLMPPGLTVLHASEVLCSDHSTLHLRYRYASQLSPFGIEIVSLGRERIDDPIILLRLPADDGGPLEQFYHSADKANVAIPAPFAKSADLIASGWFNMSPQH